MVNPSGRSCLVGDLKLQRAWQVKERFKLIQDHNSSRRDLQSASIDLLQGEGR